MVFFMQPLTPILQFRQQLTAAKKIAEDMLIQSVDSDIAVSYAREVIAGWDRLDHLERLSFKITEELAEIEDALNISGHFELSEGESDRDAIRTIGTLPSGNASRALRIKVTQGMINQNLLTLTKAIRRGLMKVGEEIQIQLPPEGELLISRVLPQGNRIQERGRIRRLYEECKVRPGDFLVLEKDEAGIWKLKIEPGHLDSDKGLSL